MERRILNSFVTDDCAEVMAFHLAMHLIKKAIPDMRACVKVRFTMISTAVFRSVAVNLEDHSGGMCLRN